MKKIIKGGLSCQQLEVICLFSCKLLHISFGISEKCVVEFEALYALTTCAKIQAKQMTNNVR